MIVPTMVCVLLLGIHTDLYTQQYSHGDPTNDEQYMLELVNRARMNPTAEGIRLIETTDQRVTSAYNYFKINLPATAAAFATYQAQPPLALNENLLSASRLHCDDMIVNNYQGHIGSDNSHPGIRMQRAGYNTVGGWGENVSAYSESVWHGHCGLNVDWGAQNQIELGHRRNIMGFDSKDPVFNEIGIGIRTTTGGLMQGTVGPYVVTQTFGRRQMKFIIGVVFEDKNDNGFYDPGEGIGGVTIQPSGGTTYYAVTSASGGYTIPFTGTTSITLNATGGGLPESLTKSVSLGSVNVKLDFMITSQPPGPTSFIEPLTNALEVVRPVVLKWTEGANASSYDVEVSTSGNFSASSIRFQERTTNLQVTAPGLACGTTYFARIRSANNAGTSAWSPTLQFRTENPVPGSIVLTSPDEILTLHITPDTSSWSVQFVWEPSSNVIRYHFRISSKMNLSDPIADDSTLSQTETYATVNSSSAEWFWTVRARSECGWGPWSETKTLNLNIVSVDMDNPIGGFELYPHPASTGAPIHFRADGEIGSVRIFNLQGVVVFSTNGEGAGSVVIPSGVLATGTYIAEMYSGYNRFNIILVVTP